MKTLLRSLIAGAVLLSAAARADTYPTKPITIIVPFGGVFQVEGDTALATIEQREAGAVVAPLGRMAAHLLAASWRLDLHNLRAGFGQQQRGQWAREQGREVEDK